MDRLGWVETVPLRAGEYVLGLRVNSRALADLLRDVFHERLVPDAEPPGNISLYLAPAADGPAQELHRVYETYQRIRRTRSIREAIDTVWRELDGHDRRLVGDRILLDATVLIRDGRAHVLSRRWRQRAVDHERRWAREGLVLVDRRWVELDLAEATLAVQGGGVAWNGRLEERIAVLGETDLPVGRSPEGSYPIATWALDASLDSPARAVMTAAHQFLDRSRHDGRHLIVGLVRLLDEAELVDGRGVRPERVPELLAAV